MNEASDRRAESKCGKCGSTVSLSEQPSKDGDVVYSGICSCGEEVSVEIGGAT